jgi:long-chain acyl-CoA synthetase
MRPLDQYPNIPAAFFALTEAYAGATGCERLIEDRSHPLQRKKELITRGALAAKVDALARYLINLGLMPGDRVAIISNTRVEWTIADLAILSAGGVTVSVYQSLVGDELGYILFDSGAKFAFVENEEQLKKILNLHHSGVRIPATEIRGECFGTILFEGIIAFEEVSDNGAISLGAAIAEGEKLTTVATLSRWQAVQPNDLAALVYTSGTTGPPKGVMQTHRNHLANTRQAADSGHF